MKSNRRQSEPKHLKWQVPKTPSISRSRFQHRDRGVQAGRVKAG
jgi:hypothetical protein